MPPFSCFVDDNIALTIPYNMATSKLHDRGITLNFVVLTVKALSRPCIQGHRDVYEINTWLWNFGRQQPQVGKLSVVKYRRIIGQSKSQTSRRAWKTRQAHKHAAGISCLGQPRINTSSLFKTHSDYYAVLHSWLLRNEL